ncbi:hypothetical protein [Pelovirga terrestris]|uniref:Uncharacterized protein n=1 Tax=Pelovirga terrestris TaxID=2771352 RepID=A0A8J6QM35_9BACT|nr:hypothetical protein [Pelovirga terrestris]MBD1399503.1 hypothetical protein [Pelovirga terrestris]
MTISERYRDIVQQLEQQADDFYTMLPEEATKPLHFVDRAAEELEEWVESVGEIPRNQLEIKLSPVLLKAHGDLDRARVQLEQAEHHAVAALIWEMEQLLYRLLNDL